MTNDMKVGDLVLFYHSSTEVTGVAGVARVSAPAIPDDSAWNTKSGYYDPKSTPEKPVWFMVELEFVEKCKRFISLEEMKADPQLMGLMVIRRGMRLSIQPVEERHFNEILKLASTP